ncbi:MAG: HU family DNA-binding protein [Phycisphaerae bacterium]
MRSHVVRGWSSARRAPIAHSLGQYSLRQKTLDVGKSFAYDRLQTSGSTRHFRKSLICVQRGYYETLPAKGTFMHTVTKKELVDRIADKTTVTRVVVKNILQSFLDEMISELGHGNRLEFRDFGVFETKERAARVAQNPKTLQRVQVPPKRTVKFKVGRMMKQKLQEGLRSSGPAPTA